MKSKLALYFVRLCVFVPLWWMRLRQGQRSGTGKFAGENLQTRAQPSLCLWGGSFVFGRWSFCLGWGISAVPVVYGRSPQRHKVTKKSLQFTFCGLAPEKIQSRAVSIWFCDFLPCPFRGRASCFTESVLRSLYRLYPSVRGCEYSGWH